ncbi:hypothetical protein PybrP1_012865 [[Pythium] brassicae (nom. inval.)]|nr:hypothetical protein PybrP1_012865 [[Pythium] brassicae (nom. inval.)]
MASSRCPLALLVLLVSANALLVLRIQGARVHVRVHSSGADHLRNQLEAETSETASVSQNRSQPPPAALACGASFLPNALSTACPSVCGARNFCVYYPTSPAGGRCTPRYGSTCYDGDSCTFECIAAWGGSDAWYITLYNNIDTFVALDAENSALAIPSVLVNASVVSRLGDFKRSESLYELSMSGNELASSIRVENTDSADVMVPRGEVVNFSFPTDFLRELKNLTSISIENIPFPSFADVADLKFGKLRALLATNTMLKAMPIKVVNLPVLEDLDLGTNYIEKIERGTLPKKLVSLALYQNFLREVPEDVREMQQLTRLGAIPVSVEELDLANCSLTKIPEDIERMDDLTVLDLSKNNFTAASMNLSILPESLEILSLDSLGLKEIPSDLSRLRSLKDLSLTGNPFAKFDVSHLPSQINSLDVSKDPIAELQPGALPSSLERVHFLQAKLPMIPAGTLPSSMLRVWVENSSLLELPADLAKMTRLNILTLDGNNLTKAELGDNLQTLTSISIKSNALRSFSARLTAATFVALSANKLASFEVSKATNLQRLHLDRNELKAIPSSIFNMTKLKVLTLYGNPISGYAPTIDEFAFLTKLNLLTMDSAQFAAGCSVADRRDLHGYAVCLGTGSGASTSANGRGTGSRTVSVVLNVLLVLVLALVLAAAWHKRRLRRRAFRALVAKELAVLRSKESGIWEDDVLLRHRVDAASVARRRLVAAGMFGEVWLAVYNDEIRALATRCTSRDPARRPTALQVAFELRTLLHRPPGSESVHSGDP